MNLSNVTIFLGLLSAWTLVACVGAGLIGRLLGRNSRHYPPVQIEMRAGEFWAPCDRCNPNGAPRPVTWERLTVLEEPVLLCRGCRRDYALEPGLAEGGA